MNYKILASHQEYFDDGKLKLVAVLWQSNKMGWVRGSYSTSKPIGGYKFLMPSEEISPYLLQRVAGAGMNLPDYLKRKFFPGKKNWEH